jgi:glyoxalase family protein
VTAIAAEPRENLRFYTEVLGLRLVKRTVNFDDPTTWHLYFADRVGTPGTLMTFFPHPMSRPGIAGSGEVGRTLFTIPTGSHPFWERRLRELGVDVAATGMFGRARLEFADGHGTRLGLVEGEQESQPVATSQVPGEMAIRGIHTVRIDVCDASATADFLVRMLGFRFVREESGVQELLIGEGDGGHRVEVAGDSGLAPPILGAGSVHHVAWRVPDDPSQLRLREELVQSRVGVTEVRDRNYFHSIYFREPGGTIFEIATDGPGFMIDETEEMLGTQLKLPPHYERLRPSIERRLPPLD